MLLRILAAMRRQLVLSASTKLHLREMKEEHYKQFCIMRRALTALADANPRVPDSAKQAISGLHSRESWSESMPYHYHERERSDVSAGSSEEGATMDARILASHIGNAGKLWPF